MPPQDVLPKQGFCVRDRQEIPFDQKRPYCAECYRKLPRFKKKDYKEKYCHAVVKNTLLAWRSPVQLLLPKIS